MDKLSFCLILFSITVLFSVTSCGDFEEISIGEPENFQVLGFENNYLKVKTKVPVNNPTLYRIKIQEIDLRVFLNNKFIGKLLVDENIVLKPMRKSVLELPVKIRLSNILNTAFIMMNIKSGQETALKFEGTVKAKSLFITKTIEVKETRLVKF